MSTDDVQAAVSHVCPYPQLLRIYHESQCQLDECAGPRWQSVLRLVQGHLVSIEQAEEQQFLQGLIPSQYSDPHTWIAASDANNEGTLLFLFSFDFFPSYLLFTCPNQPLTNTNVRVLTL